MNTTGTSPSMRAFLKGAASAAVLAAAAFSTTPAFALVTPDGVTPASVVDNANTRPYWVGLGIRNEAGNSGGTCTGLLINPRTVLFAAHCVDGVTPAGYDFPTAPLNRAQVGYTTDPTLGRTNLREWLFGQDFVVPAGDARVMDASSVMVWWDPRSRFGPAPNPARTGTFLPADVAIAGFDTPNELLGRDAANGIALLFSPVTGPVTATIGGFGQSGNGFDGTRTSSLAEESYFRRLGQNVVSFLGDERTLATGVYGPAVADLLEPPPGTNYQDLYWADFDNPLRAVQPFFSGPGADPLPCPGTNLNCRLDHDPFPGNAIAGESITGPGDSGSPLVTTIGSRQVSLGVLSQGSRFFYDSIGNPDDDFIRSTGFSNYGTLAGYNPLFLFWDQIVVNNPYKYVQAAVGNGEWTDPSRWTQELDPLYVALTGTGSLINALPTTPALGSSSAAANFGPINPSPAPIQPCTVFGTCPPVGGTSEPVPGSIGLPDSIALPDVMSPNEDMTVTHNVHDTGAPGSSGGSGGYESTFTGAASSVAAAGPEESVIGDTAMHEAATTLLWSSGSLIAVNTGALTGPGTTGFVPDNTNGTAGLQNSTRFFEVNLRNAGTTFLTGTTVTIDRLNVRGNLSELHVRSGARLNTTISSFVDAGMLTVNGIFDPTNLTLFGGGMRGTGSVDALVTNVAGVVAPGNSIGTLNIVGNYVQGAGGLLAIELSSTATDLLSISGTATLAGGVAFSAFGTPPLVGQTWTFLNAAGGRAGTFGTVVDNLPGLLNPTVGYTANTAFVTISASTFCSVAGVTGPVRVPVCTVLDNPAAQAHPVLGPAITQLQLIDPGTIPAALEALNPTRAHAQGVQGLMYADLLKQQFGTRSHDLFDAASGGQQSALLRLPSAQLATTAPSIETMVAAAEAATAASSAGVSLPNGYGWYAAADYAEGSFNNASGQDDTDAAAFTLGIDYSNGATWIVGAAVSYLTGAVDQEYGFGGSLESDGFAVSGYGDYRSGKFYADGYLSYGSIGYDTNRTLLVGPMTFASSVGSTDGSQIMAGVTIGHELFTAGMVEVGGVGGLYYVDMTLDGYTETGAGPLSAVIPERTIDSLKGSLGLEAVLALDSVFKPFARVQYVHEFSDDAFAMTSAFAGAPAFAFATPGPQLGENWVTVGGGVSAKIEDWGSLYVRYQGDIGRDNANQHGISAAARFAF